MKIENQIEWEVLECIEPLLKHYKIQGLDDNGNKFEATGIFEGSGEDHHDWEMVDVIDVEFKSSCHNCKSTHYSNHPIFLDLGICNNCGWAFKIQEEQR